MAPKYGLPFKSGYVIYLQNSIPTAYDDQVLFRVVFDGVKRTILLTNTANLEKDKKGNVAKDSTSLLVVFLTSCLVLPDQTLIKPSHPTDTSVRPSLLAARPETVLEWARGKDDRRTRAFKSQKDMAPSREPLTKQVSPGKNGKTYTTATGIVHTTRHISKLFYCSYIQRVPTTFNSSSSNKHHQVQVQPYLLVPNNENSGKK